jgi:hypothetical protein
MIFIRVDGGAVGGLGASAGQRQAHAYEGQLVSWWRARERVLFNEYSKDKAI